MFQIDLGVGARQRQIDKSAIGCGSSYSRALSPRHLNYLRSIGG
ncbi:hypothetical protein [Microcoleus sp. CAWBG58]|nr:hypothetical protein [Microcoleus sp. CAWBG58]